MVNIGEWRDNVKDYDIIITIGATGIDEDEVLDKYRDILFFIQDNLELDNYRVSVEEVGEYMD